MAEITWRFAVGDWVQRKTLRYLPRDRKTITTDLLGVARETYETRSCANPGQVVTRLAEECSGGVQLQYRVRFDGCPIDTFHEMELDPLETPRDMP